MQCPACHNQLTKMNIHNVELDVCKNSCGGIWFDSFELKKFDEIHEESRELLSIPQVSPKNVDKSKDRQCPKCLNITMMRHYFGAKRKTEVDECAKCGGTWLDAGELHEIHISYPSEEERKKAAIDLFNDIATPKLEEMRRANQEELASAKKFARIFRFICPSWYIGGGK